MARKRTLPLTTFSPTGGTLGDGVYVVDVDQFTNQNTDELVLTMTVEPDWPLGATPLFWVEMGWSDGSKGRFDVNGNQLGAAQVVAGFPIVRVNGQKRPVDGAYLKMEVLAPFSSQITLEAK